MCSEGKKNPTTRFGAVAPELPFEEHSVVWLAQVKGSVLYRLEPDPICETTCKPIGVTLKPGETLVVPQDLWTIQLKNSKDSEPAVVVAATGTWD
ncbi:Hypp2197 [Branchiostoma lanceolatum]|uniref:Hypp2197 protein n=1 Tax=Branchiostoma lanceolatum TaxID=7740 RepID=A0A8J9ZQU1_BRALA|nr:Hypp2197 [Branchiostoma lanceolatum]